jgi:hypothetical protein
MLSGSRILIGGLAVAVVALAVALGLVLAAEDDDDGDHMMLMAQSGYAGMMGAMGSMDSDAMLQHMKEVLGDEGFKRMQQHLQDHRSGGAMTGDTQVDQMMHTMMDGMMGQIGLIPSTGGQGGTPTPTTDAHHETPTAATATR